MLLWFNGPWIVGDATTVLELCGDVSLAELFVECLHCEDNLEIISLAVSTQAHMTER